MKLSTAEMLSVWRLRQQLEPLRSDCVVSRVDGTDTDALLLQHIDDWYETLLDTAPAEMLVLTDVSSQVAMNNLGEGMATVILPERCRRVVEIMASDWQQPAVIVAPDSPLALLQGNVYSRAGKSRPVAVVDRRVLRLYGVDSKSRLSRLLCVMQPDDGFYEFNKRALSTISQL